MSLLARAALLSLVSVAVAAARADEPAFADDPVVRGAIPPELQAVLLEADRFEVLLIACERDPAPGEERLRTNRYPIVGRVELPVGAERAKLLSRLYQGIAEGDQNSRAGCFEPHHAIRATRGERTVDLVICFQCVALEVWDLADEHFARAQISGAARPELERLLGPIVDRAFAGRTLEEWRGRLHELVRATEGPPALESGDVGGVRILADAIAWAGMAAPGYVRALKALGPAAAPALPKLREYLTRDPLDAELLRWSLELVETIGAPAADLASVVLERLRDIVEVRVPRERLGDHPDHLALAAIGALGGIGPAAREAVPILARLAADPGRESALREEAERAVQRITRS